MICCDGSPLIARLRQKSTHSFRKSTLGQAVTVNSVVHVRRVSGFLESLVKMDAFMLTSRYTSTSQPITLCLSFLQ